jgi:hypothetical protein
MKKLSVFLFVCLVLAVSAFGSGLEYDIKLSYDSANDSVSAEFNISEGNSIVGHLGLLYNTEKLVPVKNDFSSLPDVLAGSSVKLEHIVKPGSEHIVITPELLSVDKLVNTSEGYVLFGWYALRSVECVKAGENVATICFKLKDGIDISEITLQDIAPVKKEGLDGLAGWTGGIMAVDTDEKYYYYEPEAGAEKIEIKLVSDMVKENTDMSDNGADSDNNSTVTENNPEDETESKNEDIKENIENIPTEETNVPCEEDVPQGYDFGVKVSTYSDKIRVVWNKPESYKVREYRLYIYDGDGYLVKSITGITDITRSITVKHLAHDFEFDIAFGAVKIDGSIVGNTQKYSVKTARSSGEPAKIFTVKYKATLGSIYGMQSEQVIFGGHPTKAPIVYAPEGYVFTGWSVDGKNPVDFSKLKIYSDTVLTAVFTKE